MTDERWLPIKGLEGRYDISDAGRVRSHLPHAGLALPRILSPWSHKSGHLYVTLSASDQTRRAQVHRLVLLAFVGPPGPGEECRHLDGIPTNNALDNLAWGSRSENVRDMGRHRGWGHVRSPSGYDHYRAKFTDEDIRCIRAEPTFHGVNTMLGRCFGVNPRTIERVRRRETYTEVSDAGI